CPAPAFAFVVPPLLLRISASALSLTGKSPVFWGLSGGGRVLRRQPTWTLRCSSAEGPALLLPCRGPFSRPPRKPRQEGCSRSALQAETEGALEALAESLVHLEQARAA